MKILKDEELKTYLRNEKQYKPRELFAHLDRYLSSEHTNKVCCLYGLRRTGKTTMMKQAMRENDVERCAYLFCTDGDDISTLSRAIDSCKDKDFIFIDEATRLENFIFAGSVLSDIHMNDTPDRKIVLTGTDSLGFLAARGDELYDRMEMIHTTYIPYREFHNLLGKTIEDYIQYGGTLTPESTNYNLDDPKSYVNSAIIENLLHTIEKLDERRKFTPLTEHYYNHDLHSYVGRVLEMHNRQFLASIVNRAFKSHDLGSVRDFIEKQHKGIDTAPFKDKKLLQDIMTALNIKDHSGNPVTKEEMEELKKYLKHLDVLIDAPGGEVIFTQPGMRYGQVTDLIELVRNHEAMSGYTPAEKNFITSKLIQDVEGQLLEDIVYTDLIIRTKGNKQVDVFKVQDELLGKEVDVAVWDKNNHQIWLFEVKRTNTQDEEQSKHLRDKDFLAEISDNYGAEIVAKTVLYQGPDAQQDFGRDQISYRNVSAFLAKTDISQMLAHNEQNRDAEGRVTDIQAEIEQARRMVQGTKKAPSGNPDDVGNHDKR